MGLLCKSAMQCPLGSLLLEGDAMPHLTCNFLDCSSLLLHLACGCTLLVKHLKNVCMLMQLEDDFFKLTSS